MKFLLLLTLSSLLTAQIRISRTLEYEPDGTDQAERFYKVFQPNNVGYHFDPVLKIVTLYAETKEKLDESEAVFRRYYKPKPAVTVEDRNVEITLHILHGKSGPPSKGDAPTSLNAVIQQLKQVTDLTTFNNLETQILRVGDGKRFEASGLLDWLADPDIPPPNYIFKAELSLKGQSIKLNNLRVAVPLPYKVGPNQIQFRELGINTALDLKSGQQVVVGKTNASSKDGALIFVISARIVD